MPSATARRMYEDQIPSFMSVFDLDAETMADRDTVTVVDPKMVTVESKAHVLANTSSQIDLNTGSIPPDAIHKHHDSTSTQMSESTDSSPTTTFSTTDSSPLSDPSPSSSPDSPVNLIPLNNYPSAMFGCRSGQGPMLSIPESGTLERPMTSPAPRRPRNMKGLSIQPPAAVTTTTPKSFATEPSSPSFIKPTIPAMKRKPSQLSLKTGTSDLLVKASLEVPASPGMPPILQRRALKHSTSSPHMLTGLKSSTFGPPGGMTFPRVLERNQSGLSEVLRPMKTSMNMEFETSITEEDSPIKTQLAKRTEFEPYHESLNNEDQKSPGYPDGPIAIYGDNVYLYLEPTAEEASQFDVVINVAREVKNPFDALSKPFFGPSSTLDGTPAPPTALDESPVPDTAATTASYATAFEFPLSEDKPMETPTTPKANPLKEPEYIHVPWDHNTDIAPDLMRLCETIDNRVKQSKKVLVHCQQGASRSASLIIAYGLYQKPELTVNDAYYAAQAKSRWISPNMKLMYSLQDFHKELSKKRLPPTSTYRPRTGRSPTKHRLTLSADAIDMTPKEPQSAPLPGDDGKSGDTDSGPSPTRPRGSSTPGVPTVSPGPASAPLTFSWREQVEEKPPPIPKLVAERPAGRRRLDCDRPESNTPAADGSWTFPSSVSADAWSLSLELPPPCPKGTATNDATLVEQTVTIRPSVPDEDALMSPRAETMTENPFHGGSQMAGLRFAEAPPTPTGGLFSPRQSIFARDPFSFFGRIASFGRPPQVADPRSPPTKGETPIVRSIDDVL
ncbi:Protein-tyrosine-phosphatase [Purpureocillium takamizusanense]|uniref:protein-tyrosine-phosphatase n=1 Tax=Purpureocillium takamizusanense TaxID=2060973 RepID=A0A9Q8Q7S8_9HYPO|nr:Protein-tyrosine-phosphatase [Purpureocillium takamizusanense]UNI14337.1 Protein-tyrosine-phosphatase [Purpureocillium takamizusanense]